jgi:D-glycero-alpha-D-manno-heptose 1-phosphate guanylyltransferase
VQGHLCTNFNSGVINQETLVNTGSYLLRKDIFEECILGDSFSFENEFIGGEVIKNKILVYKAKGDFIDIGIPEDYIKAQTYNFK